MNDTYKFRGWMWAGLCVLSLVGAGVHLIAHAAYYTLAGDLCRAAIGALGFYYHRKLPKDVWELKYGLTDERENLIQARAARMTLGVMALLLYTLPAFIENETVARTMMGTVVAGIALYAILRHAVGRRM